MWQISPRMGRRKLSASLRRWNMAWKEEEFKIKAKKKENILSGVGLDVFKCII